MITFLISSSGDGHRPQEHADLVWAVDAPSPAGWVTRCHAKNTTTAQPAIFFSCMAVLLQLSA